MDTWRERAQRLWLLGNQDVGWWPLLTVWLVSCLPAGMVTGQFSDPLSALRFLGLITLGPYLIEKALRLGFRSLVACGEMIARLP